MNRQTEKSNLHENRFSLIMDSASSSAASQHVDIERLKQLISDLHIPTLRENSLLRLSTNKDQLDDLAPFLWESPGAIYALLQEIISVYRLLSPPRVSKELANRICNAIVLFKGVVTHPETRILFLNAQIHVFLYVFLETTGRTTPIEFLRISTVGIIGHLVKFADTEVIKILLNTEIISLCLRNMEIGSEILRTVATYIVRMILLHDVGLESICSKPDQMVALTRVLNNMVAGRMSCRMLRQIVGCYRRLCENERACEKLITCIPARFRDAEFRVVDDEITGRWLQQFLDKMWLYTHTSGGCYLP